MKLDLSSLKKAIAQLEEALFYCHSDIAKKDDRLALHLRAGAIQAFEFTYESCFKMLKRYLEMTESDLPYKVDVVDWHNISQSFRNTIESKKVRLDFLKNQ